VTDTCPGFLACMFSRSKLIRIFKLTAMVELYVLPFHCLHIYVVLRSTISGVITCIYNYTYLRLLSRRNIDFIFLNQKLMRWLDITLTNSLIAHEKWHGGFNHQVLYS
jgi:hypothetical protein